MRTTRKTMLAFAAGLAGFLLLAGLPVLGQEAMAEPETSSEAQEAQAEPEETSGEAQEATGEESGGGGFTFRVDPLVIGVLETDVDTASSKFEEYRDLSSGFLGSLRLEGESGDGDRTLGFSAGRIGRDDARYTLTYGLSGRYGLLLDYNKIPHRFGNDGRMLWSQTAPGRLEIADPTQAQIQAAVEQQFTANRTGVNFAFLNNLITPYLAAAQEVDLALQRDRTLARFELGQMGPLAWGLEYRHENRRGNRPYGASFGFNNVTEIPEPIDYDTTDAELAGEWNGPRGGLRFGYRHSLFENNVSTVVWDNPFRATSSTDANAYQGPSSSSVNGSALGFADLAPDNQANLLFADGRARFAGNWWVGGNLSYNVMTQDDPLLPYTLNTSIVGLDENGAAFDPTNPANLPVRNADTEVDVLALNADAGTRFGDDLELIFRARYYDYDNQSPRIEFPGYVRYHGVWEEIPRITVPYAYTRQDLGAELNWDFARASKLGFGYRLQSWDREFREVESSDEDVLFVTFDTQPVPWVAVRARYEFGDRSVDEYVTEAMEASFVHPEGITNQPELRKFAQAARRFDEIRIDADFLPVEFWTFTVGVNSRTEDFDESLQGLLEDELLQYNAELSYTPGEHLTFYLFGHRADRDVFQRSRQSGATPSTRAIDNWELDMNEVNDTWGLGLTSAFTERWKGQAEGRWSRSDGFADFTAFPGGAPLAGRPVLAAQDFDNYEDIELLALLGRLDYRLGDYATAGFIYRYEDYTIDSFILQDLRNYLPGALLLNPNLGDYQANVFGLELRLAF